MRHDFPVHGEGALPNRGLYRLLTSVIVPRPIAWVTSRSAAGVDNLAPHSFYTVSCVDPAMVQFTSVGVKDTLRNVRETGEFVVHLLGERHVEVGNASGTDYPADVSELEALELRSAFPETRLVVMGPVSSGEVATASAAATSRPGATVRPVAWSRARYTIAMPPLPASVSSSTATAWFGSRG